MWFKFESFKKPITNQTFIEKAKTSLIEKESKIHALQKSIYGAIANNDCDTLFSIFSDDDYKNLDNENISIHIFKHDSLVFWTNNKVKIQPLIFGANNINKKIQRLSNGWYYFIIDNVKQYTIVNAIKIKDEFSVQNEYLKSEFLLFDLKKQQVELSVIPKSEFQNFSYKNTPIFSFRISHKTGETNDDLFSFLLVFFAFISLTFSIYHLVNWLIKNSITATLLVACIIIFLRYFTIEEDNLFWSDHILFNPQLFAISIINASLGDYLINVFLLSFIVHSIISNFSFSVFQKLNLRIYIVFSVSIVLVLSFVFTKYVSVLVTDSNINFNFNNFSELNATTFIAIAIIGFFCNIYYQIVASIISKIVTQISVSELILMLCSLLFIWLILLFTQFNLEASNFFFIAIIFLLLYIFNHSTFINTTYSKVVFIISVFAIWTSIIINKQLIQKKEQTSRLLAEKLSVEKDVVAENLFNEFSDKIQTDSILITSLFKAETSKQQFFKRLTEKYFNGYWDKFETKMYLYDATCNQVAKSTNANDEKLTVFEEVCSKQDLESSAKKLFYVPTENDEDAGLLCKFVFIKTANQIEIPLTLYIQFTIKYNADEIGFPSLLLDKKIGQNKEKYNEFSYAKYRNNLLIPISKNNTYNYPLNSSFIEKASVQKQMILNSNFFNFGNYRHFFYKPYKTSAYVVSFKYLTFFEKLSISSYFFIFFIFLFLLNYVIYFPQNISLPTFDTLNKKIRAVLITSVFAGLLIMATVTTYFLVSHFNKDKNEKLTENIQSLLIEIGNKFGDENELSTINTEYYNYLLSKSSNVFFNDINLYNTQGNLIASSRFKIFDEGILSSKINTQAYTALKFGSDAQFINSEKIGKLTYISVYVPFVNNKNKLIGYIHLPFFDKENLLNKEIFNLLATILNLYLILFVFIAVATWWMTNKITKPLIVLKQRFADIDLGKSNAIIDWQANDEIGSVVKEYNSMVVQLNDSAAKLAQNQREMAWREMAKQVAHEIKNPLTPMKLNVQLLQRNIGLDETTFKQKFQNVATSLIEQIDSLANIANDFSTFAQITKNKPENIDLIEVTENVIAFFKSTENTEIIFNHNINSLPFYADKDHIVRILNNLIKNSIQAENNNKTIIIKVNISQIENNIILSVADNGCGINENMKDNIFKPYFTTKTSGTGLGLAMIHQIVESMNGKIYFEDEQPSGTKFTIEFNIK